MRNRFSERVARIDEVGGRLYARALGILVLLAVVAIGVPMLIGSLRQRAWGGAAVVAIAVAGGLALVRYLFSKKRRLSELE